VLWLFRWLDHPHHAGAAATGCARSRVGETSPASSITTRRSHDPNPVSWCCTQRRAGSTSPVAFNHFVELIVPFFVFDRRSRGASRRLSRRLSAVPHRERQSLVPQLADDRARARLFRR
jgi:hypothetical protein